MFCVSLTSVLIYYSINSNRNSIFILLFNLMVLYLTFKRKKTKLNLGFGIKFGIFTLILFLLFHQLGENRLQQDVKRNSAEYSAINSLNGAFGNHENIVWLLENDHKKTMYYGATYLAGITNFIPRAIWKDKPVGAGPILKNTIYPYSYNIGDKGNSSLTTGLFNELQMNFGIFGILFGAIFYGILLKKINISLMQSTTHVSILINQYILIVFSTVIVYSEFLGFFSRFIITLIPLLILKNLLKK